MNPLSPIQWFSHFSGWMTFANCSILLAKYAARKSKNPTLNKKLSKIHRPLGHIVVPIVAIHGITALVSSPQRITENYTGVILAGLILCLFQNFHTRTKHGGNWFRRHQQLASAFVPLLFVHIALSVL